MPIKSLEEKYLELSQKYLDLATKYSEVVDKYVDLKMQVISEGNWVGKIKVLPDVGEMIYES